MSHTRLLMRLLAVILIGLLAYAAPIRAQDDDAGAQPVETHYALSRPISSKNDPRAALGFPFGWHRNNRSPLHHGVDMVNPRGTAVLAAADGVIYYAGPDTDRQFGPQTSFYGNVIVIQHDFDAPEGGRVYTLYGHLNSIDVQPDQRVAVGEKIGAVGATGIALGSHLHFEVRLGDPNDYFAVRNPELWYAPLPGTGTLIGRMLNVDDSPASGVRYAITTAKSSQPGYTYADPALRSDPTYNENFTFADLAKGCYRLRVRGGAGYVYDKTFCIEAGQTLFIEARLSN